MTYIWSVLMLERNRQRPHPRISGLPVLGSTCLDNAKANLMVYNTNWVKIHNKPYNAFQKLLKAKSMLMVGIRGALFGDDV